MNTRDMLRRLPGRIADRLDRRTGKVYNRRQCWEWTGARSSKGYGSIWYQGRAQGAHRVVWHLLFGDLPDETPELDHLCKNRACCNPAHLEPVDRAENCRRSTCWHHLVKKSA